MALSTTQSTLLAQLQGIFTANGNAPVSATDLKARTGCKSFDTTFNALLFRGYVDHARTGGNPYANLFILTTKGMKQ